MKGFFGIINLGNGLITNFKELFLDNYPEVADFQKIDSENFFLTGIHSDFPPVTNDQFPDLTFAGWCRLDNLDLLQSELGLGQSTEEPELILHSFKKWGADCLKRFIGDFSFVIWDHKHESLFLAKDQLGVRPLFYLIHKNLFFSATDISLIKKALAEKLPHNKVFITKGLNFLSQDAGLTVLNYRQIQENRNLLSRDSIFNLSITDSSFKFSPTYKGWLKDRICMSDTTLRLESEVSYANQYNMETVYPLADIRLLEILYSLPIHLFKPKPYNQAIFRNVCKGILPDKVRLQKKYNGAYTLAFYDYLEKRKQEELKDYEVLNQTGLLISEEEFLKKDKDAEELERLIYRKEVDYIIGLNWPTFNEA